MEATDVLVKPNRRQVVEQTRHVVVEPPRHVVEPTRYVYLAAYYRGGSTLLGELFNQNEDVFYWFEPLAGVQEDLANSYMHVENNGSIK